MNEICLESGTIFKYEEYINKNDPITSITLCIHGAFQTSFVFRNLINSVRQYHPDENFISINLTGFGKSSNNIISTDNLLELTIGDLNNFFEIYNSKYPGIYWKIIAFSFGTYVSMSWIIDYKPKNIKCLILASPYGIFSHLGFWAYFWGIFFKTKIYKKIVSFINLFFKYKDYIIEPRNYSCELISNEVYTDLYSMYLKNSLIERFSSISVPVYFIYGGYDSLCPYEQGNILQILFPGIIKGFYVFRHLSHNLVYDEEFNSLIRHILFDTNFKSMDHPLIKSSFNIWKTDRQIISYYRSLIQ